jgi:hypothetical protein
MTAVGNPLDYQREDARARHNTPSCCAGNRDESNEWTVDAGVLVDDGGLACRLSGGLQGIRRWALTAPADSPSPTLVHPRNVYVEAVGKEDSRRWLRRAAGARCGWGGRGASRRRRGTTAGTLQPPSAAPVWSIARSGDPSGRQLRNLVNTL